ncbi:MAG: hypothetical protein R2781_00850 [Flavobacteriaceae bacterium]
MTNTNPTNDEIDLKYLLQKFKNLFENVLVLFYKLGRHILRNWMLLLGLIILGFGIGYFIEKNTPLDKKATVVIRTNFGMANYTYHALDVLVEKALSKDKAFLRKNHFRTDTVELKKINIKPFVNLSELSKGFDPEDRSLESILRNVTFEEDSIVPASFKYAYQNHLLEVTLSSVANKESVSKIISYLNESPLVKEVSKSGRDNLVESLQSYKKIKDQLDTAIEEYKKDAALPSPSANIFVVEKDFKIADLAYRKEEIIKVITKLNEDLVYSKDAIVAINEPEVITLYKSLFQKKTFLIPVLFLFLYFTYVFFIRIRRYTKKIIERRAAGN